MSSLFAAWNQANHNHRGHIKTSSHTQITAPRRRVRNGSELEIEEKGNNSGHSTAESDSNSLLSKKKTVSRDSLNQIRARINFDEYKTRGNSRQPPLHPHRMEEESVKPTMAKPATPHATKTQMEIEDTKDSVMADYFKSLPGKATPEKKVLSGVYAKRNLFNLIAKERELTPVKFLAKHRIMPGHRARMCDWMVEVLNSYECADQTFFLSMSILDRYFANQTRELAPNELHLAGCVAMFMASKYEEVNPIKIRTLVNKIAHNKIKDAEVFALEQEMLRLINFRAWAPTLYEMFGNLVSVLELRDTLTKKQFAHFEATANYILKMVVYHYELISITSYFELMLGVVAVSLKTTSESIPPLDFSAILERVKSICGVGEEAFGRAKDVVALAHNFSKIYPTLQNLAKLNPIP